MCLSRWNSRTCPIKRGRSYEDYVGLAGLERLGRRKWRRHVNKIVQQLKAALQPDYVVLGGGNARLIHKLPPGARLGDNARMPFAADTAYGPRAVQ